MLKFFRYQDEGGVLHWAVALESFDAESLLVGFNASALFDANTIPCVHEELFHRLKTACVDESVQQALGLFPVSVEREFLREAIPPPQNVVAVGMNYKMHAKDVRQKELTLFPKPVVPSPPESTLECDESWLLDWEVELGIVVREKFSSVQELDALPLKALLAGFVLTLDMSNRRPQILCPGSSFTAAKSNPGFLPVGPFFVPIENFDLSDVDEKLPGFGMSLEVNGHEKQRANSNDMIFSPKELMKRILLAAETTHENHLGQKWTLLKTRGFERGDLILTGTPNGTALRAPSFGQKLALLARSITEIPWRSPRARFLEQEFCSGKYLKPGDVVRARITHLGELSVHIAAKTPCPQRQMVSET